MVATDKGRFINEVISIGDLIGGVDPILLACHVHAKWDLFPGASSNNWEGIVKEKLKIMTFFLWLFMYVYGIKYESVTEQ